MDEIYGGNMIVKHSNWKSETRLLILRPQFVFAKRWQTFITASIIYNWKLECHMLIATGVLSYAIDRIICQLISDNSSRWHPMTFFSQKMIPTYTSYETHDNELLAIKKVLKTWRHHLKRCKHEVLDLTDYNNLHCFMDKRSLSPRQVRLIQGLTKYYF